MNPAEQEIIPDQSILDAYNTLYSKKGRFNVVPKDQKTSVPQIKNVTKDSLRGELIHLESYLSYFMREEGKHNEEAIITFCGLGHSHNNKFSRSYKQALSFLDWSDNLFSHKDFICIKCKAAAISKLRKMTYSDNDVYYTHDTFELDDV